MNPFHCLCWSKGKKAPNISKSNKIIILLWILHSLIFGHAFFPFRCISSSSSFSRFWPEGEKMHEFACERRTIHEINQWESNECTIWLSSWVILFLSKHNLIINLFEQANRVFYRIEYLNKGTKGYETNAFVVMSVLGIILPWSVMFNFCRM